MEDSELLGWFYMGSYHRHLIGLKKMKCQLNLVHTADLPFLRE